MGQNAEELKRDIAQTRTDLSSTLDAIGDRVIPGRIIERKKNRFTQGARTVKDRVMGTASDTGHTMSDAVQGFTDAASVKVHELTGAATDMPNTAKRQAQGSPVAAGAIALGVGFLLAAAIPPSQKEQELSGQLLEKAEPLKEQLADVAHDMADHLKEPAAQAVADVKEAATDAAKQVASSSSDAAHEVVDQASDAAQTVKHQGSGS